MTKSIRIIILLAITLSTTNIFGLNRVTNLPEKTKTNSFTVEIFEQGKPILYLPGFTVPGSIWKETVENQYSNLPNKTIIMATNSKHFKMFDQPEWFYKTVNYFLADAKK